MSASTAARDAGSDASSDEAVIEGVIEGADGWLFADDRARVEAFGPDGASDWGALLAARHERFSRAGIAYLHLAVPDKATVMHGKLPLGVPGPAERPLARLAALRGDLPRTMIDLAPYFTRQADKHPLYRKTGTGWTPVACYMACQMLCGRLGAAINPQLLGYPHEEIETVLELGARTSPVRTERVRRHRFGRDSKRRFANALVERRDALGRDDDRRLDVGSRVVFDNDSPSAVRRSVVLFGGALADVERRLLTGMLAESFHEVHFVWSEGIDDDYVARVRPDIVLTQGVEIDMARVPVDGVDSAALAERGLAELLGTAPEGGADASVDADAGGAAGRGAKPAAVGLLARLGGSRPMPASSVRRATLLGSETYSLPPPLMVQPGASDDVRDRSMRTNEVGLVDVDHARVFFDGVNWAVRTSSGADVVVHDGDGAEAKRRLRRVRRLEGTTCLFATSAGASIYYHWMLELLPKLGLLERYGVPLHTIDHFLVREIAGQWQLDTLERFGIDRSRVVETRDLPHMECERVLHVDLTCGINLKMHRFVPLWMKHLYPLDTVEGERLRLYVRRPEGVRRGISNEAELLPLLEAADIEPVAMEGRSIREQAGLLARADVVVGPHGAALTNTVFCRPGTELVELLSRHVYPYYYGLAACCGLVYHAVLENPEEDYPRLVNHRIAQSFAASAVQRTTMGQGFEVPVEAFAATLGRLRPRAPAPPAAAPATPARVAEAS